MSDQNQPSAAAPAKAEGNTATAAPAATTPPAPAEATNPPAAEGAPTAAGAAPAPEVAAPKEGEKPKAEETPPERIVPEVYEIALPEGALIDGERIEEIKAFAKEKKLTNAEAQERFDIENAAVVRDRKREAEAYEARKAGWMDELKADKEIGQENAPKAAELTSRFIDRFADENFKQILATTGLGNHPGLIKTIYRGLKATGFGEGEIVIPGAHGAPQEESPAQILYGNKK